MSDIIASLTADGHVITYAEASPGYFCDLRDADGRCIETGNGPTKAMAREHLEYRLERGALDDLLIEALEDDCTVTFSKDAADGSIVADVVTAAGVELSGSGPFAASALRDARDGTGPLEPFCAVCEAPVGYFLGHDGPRHYRGDGTPESRTELVDAGHPVAVAWREPGTESAL